MGEPAPETPASERRPEERLSSWKEIAAYLGRDVTTAQRWEKREAMPVHRHVHDKRGSVYAPASELDEWLQSRRRHLGAEPADKDDEQKIAPAVEAEAPQGGTAQRTRHWVALAGVGVVGLLAAAYFVARGHTTNASQPQIRSIAVLPLKNLSGDPAQDYLGGGMTDALIARLSRMHNLRVISRTSVMRFKNPQLSTPRIARMLHVDAIVEGSVMRQDNRIRVTAQLIRGATDEHFWSETYDRELRDVFAVQSELAQAIAEKFK